MLEKSLAGPIGILVKFPTLQDYGVDKLFFLENGNADVSQRNVVFIARGESAKHAQSIAGEFVLLSPLLNHPLGLLKSRLSSRLLPLYIVSLEPYMNQNTHTPARSIVSPSSISYASAHCNTMLTSFRSHQAYATGKPNWT